MMLDNPEKNVIISSANVSFAISNVVFCLIFLIIPFEFDVIISIIVSLGCGVVVWFVVYFKLNKNLEVR